MLEKEFNKNMNDIKSKLGDEEHGKIVGELSIFQTANKTLEEEKADLQNQLEEEKKKSEQYINANAILLQQIGTQPTTPPQNLSNNNEGNNADDKPINWDDCFDKNGKFID